jgi:thiamine biosynthesis lipoprotein ApbE
MLPFHFRFQRSTLLPIGYAWFGAMHTRMDLVVAGPAEELQREVLLQVHARVMWLDGLLNRFAAGSEVAKVNAMAASDAVAIGSELYDLLGYAQQAYEKTEGLFDITIQSGMETGHRPAGGEKPRPETGHTDAAPYASSNTLSNHALPLNPRAIVLTKNPYRVRFLHPGLQIDLGGLAKGYTVDQVRKILDDAQVRHYLISFGNSSIAAKGDRPGAPQADPSVKTRTESPDPGSYAEDAPARAGWHIALRNGSAGFRLIDECLTVSGNETQPGGHIIDPRTRTVAHNRLYAVKTATALEGEVQSTVGFLLNAER